MKKYSVLMSIYKNEKPDCFRTALDSMIHQTIEPDEIVLVEDGPLTEDLYQVIADYQQEFPSLFNILINEKNLGLGPSLSKGVLACRNEYVVRMDTDDISRPNRCEMQFDCLEKNPNIAVVGGQIEEFVESPDKPVGKRIVPNTEEKIKQYMKKRCPLNHVTVMFRKDAVLAAGNYREWFCNEDYDLWIRMALQGSQFANLSETLVDVRVGTDMYSRRGGKKYFKSEVEIQKMMLKNKMIGVMTFISNCGKRLIVQMMLPNSVRGWVFKKFARNDLGDEFFYAEQKSNTE